MFMTNEEINVMKDIAQKTNGRLEAFAQVMELIDKYELDRAVFMELYRESKRLPEQMSTADAKEVFLTVLHGEDDITEELFDELCKEYGVSFQSIAYNAQFLYESDD